MKNFEERLMNFHKYIQFNSRYMYQKSNIGFFKNTAGDTNKKIRPYTQEAYYKFDIPENKFSRALLLI